MWLKVEFQLKFISLKNNFQYYFLMNYVTLHPIERSMIAFCACAHHFFFNDVQCFLVKKL